MIDPVAPQDHLGNYQDDIGGGVAMPILDLAEGYGRKGQEFSRLGVLRRPPPGQEGGVHIFAEGFDICVLHGAIVGSMLGADDQLTSFDGVGNLKIGMVIHGC